MSRDRILSTSLFFGALIVLLSSIATRGDDDERILSARIVTVHGRVLLRSPGTSDWRQVAAGDAVPAGAAIQSESGSSAVVELSPKNEVRMAERSLIVLEKMVSRPGTETATAALKSRARRYQILIRHQRGRILSMLKNLPEGSTYEVQTPAAAAKVKGTTFLSEVPEEGDEAKAEILSLDGVVRVTSPFFDGIVDLRPKELAHMEEGGVSRVTKLSDAQIEAVVEAWAASGIEIRLEELRIRSGTLLPLMSRVEERRPVLEPDRAVEVKVMAMSDDGKPLPGVEIEGRVEGPGYLDSPRAVTDTGGVATFTAALDPVEAAAGREKGSFDELRILFEALAVPASVDRMEPMEMKLPYRIPPQGGAAVGLKIRMISVSGPEATRVWSPGRDAAPDSLPVIDGEDVQVKVSLVEGSSADLAAARVEVSLDGGATWRPASRLNRLSYALHFTAEAGQSYRIRARVRR